MGATSSDNQIQNVTDATEGDSPTNGANGIGDESTTQTPPVDKHTDFTHRDKGGFMKFLNWTGVTLVGLPTVALAGFVIYKVATKKKGG